MTAHLTPDPVTLRPTSLMRPPHGMVPVATISLNQIQDHWSWPTPSMRRLIDSGWVAAQGVEATDVSPLVDLEQLTRGYAIATRGRAEGRSQDALTSAILHPDQDSVHLRRLVGRFLLGFLVSFGHLGYVHGWRRQADAVPLGRVRDCPAELHQLAAYMLGHGPS